MRALIRSWMLVAGALCSFVSAQDPPAEKKPHPVFQGVVETDQGPFAGAEVQLLLKHGGQTLDQHTTGADGTFELEGQATILNYLLAVTAPGYGKRLLPCVAPETQLGSILIQRLPKVSVTLLDEEGDLVLDSDWALEARGGPRGSTRFDPPDNDSGRRALSPSFVLGLMGGGFRVVALHKWSPEPIRLGSLQLGEGEDQHVVLELPTPAWERSLRLKLLVDSGYAWGGDAPRVAVTDALGRVLSEGRTVDSEWVQGTGVEYSLLFEALPVGEALLLKSLDGDLSLSSQTFTAGELVEFVTHYTGALRVTLDPEQLQVYRHTQAPVQAWALPLHALGDPFQGLEHPHMLQVSLGAGTDELRVDGLPRGSWRVSVQSGRNVSSLTRFEVRDLLAGEERAVDLRGYADTLPRVEVHLTWDSVEGSASPTSRAFFRSPEASGPRQARIRRSGLASQGQGHSRSRASVPARLDSEGVLSAMLPFAGPWTLVIPIGQKRQIELQLEAVAGETVVVEHELPFLQALTVELVLPEDVHAGQLQATLSNAAVSIDGVRVGGAATWRFADVPLGELRLSVEDRTPHAGRQGLSEALFTRSLTHERGGDRWTVDLADAYPAQLALHAAPALGEAMVVAMSDETVVEAFLKADGAGMFLLNEPRASRFHVDGETVLTSIEPGECRPWFTNVKRRWLARAGASVALASGERSFLAIELELVTRSVQVVDADGRPRKGATLRWRHFGRDLPGARAELDEQGRAELTLPPGPVSMRVEGGEEIELEWVAGPQARVVELPDGE